MTAHKLEILVLDQEDYNIDEIIQNIVNNKYFIISCHNSESVRIDDWDDDHILNQETIDKEEINKFFKENKADKIIDKIQFMKLASEYVKSGCRIGQAFMNSLYQLDKCLYARISNTDADCFYDDKKIGSFLERIFK